MASKEKYKQYIKALDKYYKSIDKYTDNLSNVVINKKYMEMDRKIQGLDILYGKGKASDKDIDKMIKTLNKYTGTGTVDLFDAYDPSLDKFVSPIKGGFYSGNPSTPFNKKDTILNNRERKQFQPITESTSIDYNTAFYEEFYDWLRRKPEGYVADILNVTNRMLDEYGHEGICKLFEMFQEELPDINSKIYYEADLKPLYHLVTRMEANGWFYLDEYDERMGNINARLNETLEQEESYE